MARSKKLEKNLSKVQDMLDGKNDKIQVGYGTAASEETRKEKEIYNFLSASVQFFQITSEKDSQNDSAEKLYKSEKIISW